MFSDGHKEGNLQSTSQVSLTVTFMKHKIEKRLPCNVKKKVVIAIHLVLNIGNANIDY